MTGTAAREYQMPDGERVLLHGNQQPPAGAEAVPVMSRAERAAEAAKANRQ